MGQNPCCCGKCLCCIGKRQPATVRVTLSGVGGGGCCDLWNAAFDLVKLGPDDDGYAIEYGCVTYGIDLTGTDLIDCYPDLRVIMFLTDCEIQPVWDLHIHTDYAGALLTDAKWRIRPGGFFEPIDCTDSQTLTWYTTGSEGTYDCDFSTASVTIDPL
jgi:hypothetical protein